MPIGEDDLVRDRVVELRVDLSASDPGEPESYGRDPLPLTIVSDVQSEIASTSCILQDLLYTLKGDVLLHLLL